MDIKGKKFHFVAVGGVGMSGLAKYLSERGAEVSGSDIAESKYTHMLESKGVKVSIGHDRNLISEDMIVVASSAIKSSNLEIIRAKELNLKIYHRSDVLKMISDEFSSSDKSFFIGFCGTHGKTTTSGLASYVLSKAGLEPSFVVGGIIPELNVNSSFSSDKFFIAELDESDGTIQKYSTDIAVINNMEEDHLDYYTNGFDDIAKTFYKFLSNKKNQKVIVNIDDTGVCEFIKRYDDFSFVTFGLSNADYCAKNIKISGLESEFDIFYKDEKIDTVKLSIPGKHNIYNALAVYAALKEAGVNVCEISQYFYSFSGMGRRFQKTGCVCGIDLYDDYAHHPSEIKTTLNGVKTAVGSSRRVIVLFQPHRYTRLQGLWNEFLQAFSSADKLLVADVYSAGEDSIEGINSKDFASTIQHPDCEYLSGDIEEVAKKSAQYLKKGDIFITLGAGSVTKAGQIIIDELNGAVR